MKSRIVRRALRLRNRRAPAARPVEPVDADTRARWAAEDRRVAEYHRAHPELSETMESMRNYEGRVPR